MSTTEYSEHYELNTLQIDIWMYTDPGLPLKYQNTGEVHESNIISLFYFPKLPHTK